MEYFILTNETAIKYALEEPSIAGFLDSIELECSEIGDGNSRIILGKFGFAIDSSDFLPSNPTMSTHGCQH